MVFDRGAMILWLYSLFLPGKLSSFLVKSDKEAYKIGIDICRSWYKETANTRGGFM